MFKLEELEITYRVQLATYDRDLVAHMLSEIHNKLSDITAEFSHDRFLIRSDSTSLEPLKCHQHLKDE